MVLIGHSQGSFVLRQLIAKEIDPKKSARKLLVSAYLLGGNVTVKQGKDVGGDFKHVRACHTKKTGLRRRLLDLRRAGAGHEPVRPDGHARAAGPVHQPGGAGRRLGQARHDLPDAAVRSGLDLGWDQPARRDAADGPDTWIEVKGGYKAECSSAGGANVLQITPQDGAPDFKPSPTADWGLHLVDANIALGDLVNLVRTQTAAWLKQQD